MEKIYRSNPHSPIHCFTRTWFENTLFAESCLFWPKLYIETLSWSINIECNSILTILAPQFKIV